MIQQVLVQVVNRFGIKNLKMNFVQTYLTPVEEFYRWQILDLIQILLNCKWRVNSSFKYIDFILLFFKLFSFITYRSCRHLDGKHTIFGKLVGGMETLNAMEQIEVDNKDCPIVDILIQKAHVFVDPFQEAAEQLANERAEEAKRKVQEEESIAKKRRQSQPMKIFRQGVGKYLDLNHVKEKNTSEEVIKDTNISAVSRSKGKRQISESFGDFSSW